MKLPFLTLLGVASMAAPLTGAIRLNEVHLNPPGGTGLGDRNYEFIELISVITSGADTRADKTEACTGLTLLIVNNDRRDADSPTLALKNLGEVSEVWSLNDFSTGRNGLLLLGNGYSDEPRGGPWAGAIDPLTAVADPVGMGDGNIGSNDGFSLFLVSGYTNPAPNNGLVVDFDVDNDGLLDWNDPTPPAGRLTAAPWTAIVDEIGFRDRDTEAATDQPVLPYVVAAANVSPFGLVAGATMGDRDPESIARRLGTVTASTASQWYGGKFIDPAVGTDPAGTVSYRPDRIFGGFLGEVTPGRANLAAAQPAPLFVLNEVNLNPSGNNDRFQYVEIANVNNPPAARSLSALNGGGTAVESYWLLVVDSAVTTGDLPANTVGNILEEWDLGAMSTGQNGLLMLGNNFSTSHTPFQDTVAALTAMGDPVARSSTPVSTAMGEGDLRSKSGLTLLLVRGYTPPLNKDLDTNDDGIRDTTPWTALIDSVGFTQLSLAGVPATGAGRTYATVDLTNTTDAANGLPSRVAPDNFGRKAGTLTTAAANWYGGIFPGGTGGSSLGYAGPIPTAQIPDGRTWFGGFRGAATPGLPNLSAAINPASPPIAGELRINEAMINPSNNIDDQDGTNEFIELRSTNGSQFIMDGHWVVIVDMEGNKSGQIVDGFWLDGYSTGLNGTAVLGDNYDDTASYPYRVTEGPLPRTTSAIDPEVGLGGNDLPNDGIAILLIRGPAYDATTNPTGPFLNGGPAGVIGLQPSGDLDPENDGTLLAPSAWLAAGGVLVDSVVVSSRDPGAGYAWVSQSPSTSHHTARLNTNSAANSAAAWAYGQVGQTMEANPLVNWTGSFVGPYRSAASPGRPNHAATPGATTVGAVVMNELHFNPAGADGNAEFVELLDTSYASRSLNGYSLVMMDNTVKNTGTIRRAWSLDGFATGGNGLCMITNVTQSPSPFAAVIRSNTLLADPAGRDGLVSSFGDATLATESDNFNATFLLVRNFTGFIDSDLDITVASSGLPGATAGDLDGDGVLDSGPWDGGAAGIHDSVVLRSYAPVTPAPVAPAAFYPYDGWTYGLADLTSTWFGANGAGHYHPETVARFSGEITANSPSAWYGGDLKGGLTGNERDDTTYASGAGTNPPQPAGFTGRVTPGQPNLPRTANGDNDTDGRANLVELALGANPNSASEPCPLPKPSLVTVSSQQYYAFTYQRLKGGTTTGTTYTAEAYSYNVQTSTDLQSWTIDAAPGGGGALVQVGSPVANADGITENVTVRMPVPVTAPGGRAYFRLLVTRF